MIERVASELTQRAAANGGFVNAHGHFDLAYTLSLNSAHDVAKEAGLEHVASLGELPLPDKIAVLDERIRGATDYEETLVSRMEHLVESFLAQGVVASRACITMSSSVNHAALDAAATVRETYTGRFALQIVGVHLTPLVGIEREAVYYRRLVSDPRIDVVGGLPQVEQSSDRASLMHLVLTLAGEVGKPLELHADEYLSPDESETRVFAEIVGEYRARGLREAVSAVHCVTLAAKHPTERRETIRLLAASQVDVVVCPRAALSMKNPEAASYLHNSLAPVRELADGGVIVALGTDNIHDVFLPFSDGSVLAELEMLAEAERIYDLDLLAAIASKNGAHVLRLSDELS